jgi:hypothetical protein
MIKGISVGLEASPSSGTRKQQWRFRSKCLSCRYQCCGSGSGIRDWVPFWPLHPGSGMVTVRIRDKHPGSATLVGTFLNFSSFKSLV